MKDKRSEVSVLTDQLVSQLLYCKSRLRSDDFDKIHNEIFDLLDSYEKKIKKLKEWPS
jgi:transcription initiation factor IIE alpha subunit